LPAAAVRYRDQQARNAILQTHDQVMESCNEIVPGMTNVKDFPGLGFDPSPPMWTCCPIWASRHACLRASGGNRQNLDPAVKACIRAGVYCTGFVFR
jgi:hypothetical protein